MKRPLTINLERELIEQIDTARRPASRDEWIAEACKAHLATAGRRPSPKRAVSSAQAKRDVTPIPKTGKK
jgi:metal-responsive CopG/Arc/MetJ family transcriptional regulator